MRINAAATVIITLDHVAAETHINTMISIAIMPLQKQVPSVEQATSFFFTMF